MLTTNSKSVIIQKICTNKQYSFLNWMVELEMSHSKLHRPTFFRPWDQTILFRRFLVQ